MDSTVSITELQDRAPQVVKRAEKNGSVAVCRHTAERGGPTVTLLAAGCRSTIYEAFETILAQQNPN
jgi:antitoxin (DNA-binding transcriptional repressor) of toxin-antitoxin stability system